VCKGGGGRPKERETRRTKKGKEGRKLFLKNSHAIMEEEEEESRPFFPIEKSLKNDSKKSSKKSK